LGDFKATEETDGNFRDAVHRVVDRVEEQARRAHQKSVDKRRRGSNHRWPVEVLAQGSIGGGGTPRVIETSQLHIKPMTIEEAAIALDGSADGFVVFRDSTSDRLSVLYKRKDQNYGLIAPEL
jgi:ribosome hibernation promoting factor